MPKVWKIAIPAPVAPAEKSDEERPQPAPVRWTAQVATVMIEDGAVTVAAEAFGPLLIFLPPGEKAAVLTHAATGNRLTRCSVRQTLKRVAELLMRELPALFALTDRAEINERRPRWVREWLRACEAADRFVDPQDFKHGKLHEEPVAASEPSPNEPENVDENGTRDQEVSG